METEEQRKDRIAKKKLEMQRLCRMLDIEDWDQNEWLLREVRSIVQKEKKAKKEAEKLLESQSDFQGVALFNSLYIANSVSK